jgi:tripartite-type tricarboxylate transporter receptor subunit TctC
LLYHPADSSREETAVKNRRLLLSVAATLALASPFSIQAQSYPTKPVRLVVPFPPGGGTDAFARPLTKVLSANLGQSFVIDNRGGAGGTLGAVHHTIAVSMYPRLGYDLQKDLTPVTVLSYVPNVVVVNPQRVAARSYASFAEYVKANPGRLNYASAGNGTTHHLTVELWKTLTGSFAAHIPYRGAGPAMQDLLAGQVDFMFDGMGSSIQHIKSGRLIPLAVSSAKRSFALPDIPTLDELGVKGYDARTWYAVWAPAGTPRDIVNRLQQEIAKALSGAELKGIWESLGAEAGGQPPEDMGKFVDGEIAKWAKVVKDSGAKLD